MCTTYHLVDGELLKLRVLPRDWNWNVTNVGRAKVIDEPLAALMI
jgi:hypothetical protein